MTSAGSYVSFLVTGGNVAKFIRFICAVVFFVSVTPAALQAQNKQARAAARAAYGRGQTLFGDEKYEEAKLAFEEAFAAVPNPIVLRSIGECEVKLGQIGAAIESFERYLSEKPGASDRPDVEAKLTELRATPAVLVLHSSPAGAEVRIDGAPSAAPTPTEVEVSPGEHRVELSASGHDAATETVQANPGERVEIELTLNPLPQVPEAAPPVALSAADFGAPAAEEGGSNTAVWITGGVGVAGLIAGGVFGAMALSKQSDYEDDPTSDGADEGERLALFADVGFGVGAISLITCAVILFTEDDGGADETALRVMPVVSTRQAGVGASMKF